MMLRVRIVSDAAGFLEEGAEEGAGEGEDEQEADCDDDGVEALATRMASRNSPR